MAVSAEGKIVVGFDGSEEARGAVIWAARQAAAEQRGLLVVHCWLWPLFTHDLGPVEGVADSGLKHAAELILEDGAAAARAVSPELHVDTALAVGAAASVLPGLSENARMLVVGSRGLAGLLGFLVGSTSLTLAASSHCPVAVVRSAWETRGPVVAGVDDSDASAAAVEDARGLAQLWGEELMLVHVGQASDALDAAAERVKAANPGLSVRTQVVSGRTAAEGLLHAAQGARVIVVGAKGRHAAGGQTGSTVHRILHHSAGTVLVGGHARAAARTPAAPGS